MEKEILELLDNNQRPSLDIIDIKDALNLDTVEEIQELQKQLNNLVQAGELYYSTNKQTYTLLKNTHFLQGKLSVNPKGFGFVNVKELEEDVYIDKANLIDARNNDIVLLEIIDKYKNEGRIVSVIKRDTKNIVGELFILDGRYYVKPKEKGYSNIYIPDDYLEGAVEGQIVLVEPLMGKENYVGKILLKIGFKEEKETDLNAIIYQYGFSPDFPPEVKEEVKTIPTEVSQNELEGRLDLRDEVIFTIDGASTKDIDDALSIKRINSEIIELGVHIADVSNYVKVGSEIDTEAFARGTSVYPGKWVFPMLPPELSNGICSLHQGVDRLAMSCIMQIDSKGRVVSYTVSPSIIRSSKKMTYENVDKLYEDGAIAFGYEPFVEKLQLLREFKDIGMKNFIARGYLDFNTPEPKIIFDENDKVIDVQASYQTEAEKCIEVAMVYANETMGSHIFYRNLPGIYRVHDKPNNMKLEKCLEFLTLKGYITECKNKQDKISVKDLQNILNQIREKDEAYVLAPMLIQTQSKAEYSNENIGHFGLGSKCYSHFTSPIRRYPDLVLHRLIKDYEQNYIDEVVDRWNYELPGICEATTEREQASDNVERDSDKMFKAEYMESHVGEIYDGIISGIQSFGMFVALPNTVEGLISVKDLDGYYELNEKTQSLYCKNNGKRYCIGDLVKVKVLAASKEASTIDFGIVKEQKEYEEEKKKSKKKKIKSR